MKINKNFVLRSIAGENMLVPVGAQSVTTNGMISLSPVAADIWKTLSEDKDYDQVLQMILDKYDVDAALAKQDLDEFIAVMKSIGIVG